MPRRLAYDVSVAAIKVMTERLALIAGTAELARAAFADRVRFEAMIEARVTEDGPCVRSGLEPIGVGRAGRYFDEKLE